MQIYKTSAQRANLDYSFSHSKKYLKRTKKSDFREACRAFNFFTLLFM